MSLQDTLENTPEHGILFQDEVEAYTLEFWENAYADYEGHPGEFGMTVNDFAEMDHPELKSFDTLCEWNGNRPSRKK